MSKRWISHHYDASEFWLSDSEPQPYHIYGKLYPAKDVDRTIDLSDAERADFERVEREWCDWQRRLSAAYNRD